MEIKGKIINKEERINKKNKYYTSQYFKLTLMTEYGNLLMFYGMNDVNKVGYMPKVSHTLLIDGNIFKSNDSMYEGVIKNITKIQHITV